MDKNINIIKTKPNDIEFELEIEGINSGDEIVNFVINGDTVNFSIKCINQSGNKWIAKIPQMDYLDATLYGFTISVIIGGYYFEPFTGSLNMIKSAELYVKNVVNSVSPAKLKAVEKDVQKPKEVKKSNVPTLKDMIKPKATPTKVSQPKIKNAIDKIADEITKSVKSDLIKKNVVPKKKNNFKVSKIDEKVKDILADMTKGDTTVKFKKGSITEI